jgi:peptidoglycan/LPS O-acetylase OafA/YrhL
VWLATMALVALIPGIPPLLLVFSVSAIVTALGLLLNILIERPALKLVRRLDWSRSDRGLTAAAADPGLVEATVSARRQRRPDPFRKIR